MTEVTIEYCVPCGLLDRAIQTQRELLEEFGRELDAVRLETGHNGVFTVSVDDEVVYDKATAEEAFDLESIAADIEARTGAEA